MTYTHIAVIGSGTMGAGIATAAALAHRTVVLHDIEQSYLDRAHAGITRFLDGSVAKGKLESAARDAALARISLSTTLDSIAPCDCVIEAVPEALALKRDLFARLAQICRSDTVLATNTSSLPVTSIATAATHPERVAGLHFFNPATLMKLVEVVGGRLTDPAVVDGLMQFARELGKTPVRVKDTPGFVVNRVARPFYNEALRIIDEQVAAPEAVDRIMRAHGFRMGPFELMDLIGNDVNYEVTRSLFEAFHGDPRYRPSHIQRGMVEAGLLGRKTGRGFYSHEEKA